jgi:citrate synthase
VAAESDTETALSLVDGEGGRLVFVGHDVEGLAGRVGFEDVCGLLWDGRLPEAAERESLRRSLAAGRVHAFGLLPRIGDALEAEDGMDALRAAAAHLRSEERGILAGALAVFAAAWARRRAGAEALAPDASLPHATDYLRMIDPQASAARAAALDTYLVTVAEHGMNASTYAARVVASTGSDAVSAVVAAIGALKGPLHGGAPAPVLDMLEAIGSPERAVAWIEAELQAGRRIMGMGHRIYRVRDPRAAVLERAIQVLEGAEAGGSRRALARAVEKAAEEVLRRRHPERALRANVEFYTAVLLDAVGLPRALFTPTFGVARVAGWLAHVQEQRRTGRLIRPAARYIGPLPA